MKEDECHGDYAPCPPSPARLKAASGFVRIGRNNERHQQMLDKIRQLPVFLAPIARGFDAFARQKWDAAVRELQAVLPVHERIGGSRTSATC